MRLGVLGGTFDPIHIGHLIAAEETRFRLELDKVLFVPSGQPPHKGHERVSSAAHRAEMARLAIATNDAFELSLLEVNRSGRSFTVDTMADLRRSHGPSAELFFIIGMDSLIELLNWKDPQGLLALCKLAVVNRRPYGRVDPGVLEDRLPGISGRVEMVPIPDIEVSSSDLRHRVAIALPIKYQVPESVERYIREQGLYRSQNPNPLKTESPSTRPPRANR